MHKVASRLRDAAMAARRKHALGAMPSGVELDSAVALLVCGTGVAVLYTLS